MKVGLFGAGAYGLALSSILNDNRHTITMWTKSKEEKEKLEKTRKNDKLLPGYVLDKKIKLTNSVEETVSDDVVNTTESKDTVLEDKEDTNI